MRTPRAHIAADGTVTWRVRHRRGGVQTSRPFPDPDSARTFAEHLAARPRPVTGPGRAWEGYADDYALLRRQGYPLEVIATRLGMKIAALDRALVRHRADPRARRPSI